MSDVQFMEIRYFEDQFQVRIVDAVSGVDLHSERMGGLCAFDQAFQFAELRVAGSVGECPGMQFHKRGAELCRGFELFLHRIDENAHADSGFGQAGDRAFQGIVCADHIQSALRGQFAAFFRDQAAVDGFEARSNGDHFFRRGHFHVQALDRSGQRLHIRVLNVPAVFPQMGGNAVRAGFFADARGLQGTGRRSHADLPQSSHMIDVDAKFQFPHHS
ncbi:MAG: hypothetical protein BWY31_03259 [Lentisphaerae bacterium ADurb.Bin242]|nr:MAG: hypothetical protein BWY31_03259 [Lentisphaerae bacterium ADurb.Bin242]